MDLWMIPKERNIKYAAVSHCLLPRTFGNFELKNVYDQLREMDYITLCYAKMIWSFWYSSKVEIDDQKGSALLLEVVNE